MDEYQLRMKNEDFQNQLLIVKIFQICKNKRLFSFHEYNNELCYYQD